MHTAKRRVLCVVLNLHQKIAVAFCVFFDVFNALMSIKLRFCRKCIFPENKHANAFWNISLIKNKASIIFPDYLLYPLFIQLVLVTPFIYSTSWQSDDKTIFLMEVVEFLSISI